MPESAKKDLIRICFQIELAHWFYLDFYVNNDPSLKACSIYEFAAHVFQVHTRNALINSLLTRFLQFFQHIPFLKNESHKLDKILSEWKEYKQSVPTYGAIMLSESMTHVLLVQSYWAKSSWGFPKGKVNEEEDPAHCAVREVLEETGFDISPHLDVNEFLESTINDQLVRLYIVKNIPMSTKFQPRTRCEIKSCSWFSINDLPNNKKDTTPKVKIGVSPNAFFMVLPFVRRIKQICYNSYHGNGSVAVVKRYRHKSASMSEGDNNNHSSSVVVKAKTVNKMETTMCAVADEVVGKYANNSGNNGKKRTDKKANQHSKRQLFTDYEQQGNNVEFCAPSWLNFKFDKTAIMECMP